MDCKECREDMTAYLDGELPPAEAAHIRSHVEECLPCAEEIYGLSEAAELVRAHHRRLEPHPAGWNRVQARIARPDPPPRLRILEAIFGRRWQPAMAAVALVAGLAIGGLGYYRHLEAERSLQSYMTDYVRAREAQEWEYRRAAGTAAAGRTRSLENDRSDNPFLLVSGTTDSNPFRR